MFQLKDILFEDEGKDPFEAAEKFIEHMNSGRWIIPQKKGIDLYRGTDREVTVGVKEKYDEVRDPMNTDPSLQDVVDTITTVRYPKRPRRSYSRFASARRGAVRSYGTPHYVFPEKDSKLVSYDNDVFTKHFARIDLGRLYENFEKLAVWVGEGDEDYKKNLYTFLRNHFSSELITIIQAYYETKNTHYNVLRVLCRKKSLKEQLEVVRKNRNKVDNSKPEDFGFDDKNGYRDLTSFLTQYVFVLEDIWRYFEKGELGLMEDAYETAVEGDLLHAKVSFVEKYLTFDIQENSWRVDLPT